MNNINPELGKNFDDANIYGKGYNSISIEELKGNETAIKQLLNQYTQKATQANTINLEIEELKTELKFYQTYPFIGIVSGVANVCGSVVISFSVNFLTMENPPQYSGWLLFVGIVLILMGVSAPLIYQIFIHKKSQKSSPKKE